MLVDTNVWSELIRPEPLPAVTALVRDRWRDLFLSSIVVAEMEYGIARIAGTPRAAALRGFVDDIVTRYGDRLLCPDLPTAVMFGRLKAQLKAAGRPIADLDLMIAAQAIAAGMPLVTRNVSDMSRTGADIIDPWREGM